MNGKMNRAIGVSILVFFVAVTFSINVQSQIARFTARDPGVRTGSNGAGGILPGLSSLEQRVFGSGKEAFQEVASVQGTIPDTEVNDRDSISTVAPAVMPIRTSAGAAQP